MLNKFIKLFKKKSKAIYKFRKKEDIMITFKELSEMPINEVIDINDKEPGSIECIRLNNNSKDLSFRVTMKKGSHWEYHHHDAVETIVIYKGVLVNLESKNKTFKRRGELMTFPAGDTHYVVAKEDSIFYVEFKKPSNNVQTMDTR